MWASAGTAAAPAAGLYDHLYLHPFPESLGDAPIASTVRRMRPLGFDGAADGGLEWISGLGVDRPCVYLTFGTEGGGPPFAPLLAAINRVDVDAVLTTGPLTDPADLAAIAGKVRVVRYVPQRFVLARASAMVSHAGSGAMIGGALLGVTQVCVPMAADQFDNADSLAATGSSLTIEPAAASEDSFFEAMSRVLHDDGVRSSAQRLARSFAALPDPASFVPAVEALV